MRSHALLVLQKTMTLTSLPAAAGRELIPARIDASRASCPPHTPASRPHPPAPRGRREAGGGRREAAGPSTRVTRPPARSPQLPMPPQSPGVGRRRAASRASRLPFLCRARSRPAFPLPIFPSPHLPLFCLTLSAGALRRGRRRGLSEGPPLLLRRGGPSEEALLLQDLSGPAHLPRGLPGGHGLPGLITASAPRSACLSEAPERGALT